MNPDRARGYDSAASLLDGGPIECGEEDDREFVTAKSRYAVIFAHRCAQSFGGLDRGRALSEMDEELLGILQPFYTPKMSYTATPAAQMLTQVFWDEPVFTPCVTQRDRLSRSAKVMVYSYQEQGE